MITADPRQYRVLLEAEDTVTGLGIAQQQRYIFPISPCHGQSYQKGQGGTRCNAEGCRKTAPMLDSFATSAAVSSTGSGLAYFVSVWTGLAEDLFVVELEDTA